MISLCGACRKLRVAAPQRSLRHIAVAGAALALSATGLPASASAVQFGFNNNYVASAPGPYSQRAQQSAELTGADGGTVDRVTIPWRAVEPTRGTWYWGLADAVYDADVAAGIRPIFVAAYAPAWANPAEAALCGTSCNYPPMSVHDSDWESFVGQMARRYPELAAIEIWNEPNFAGFWEPRVNVARYTTLLKEADATIKGVDPRMTVLNGGLCSCGQENNEPDPGDLTPANFLTGIYENSGGGSMDAISVHDYPCGPDTCSTDDQVTQLLDSIRAVKDEFGDASKALWITETGLDLNWPPSTYTVAQQAQEDVDLYQLFSGMSDVADVNINTLVDNSSEPGWGVLTSSLTPRPAYCQLAQQRGVSTPAGC